MTPIPKAYPQSALLVEVMASKIAECRLAVSHTMVVVDNINDDNVARLKGCVYRCC